MEPFKTAEKSLNIDRSASSASNGSATSGDEDCDDQKTGKSKSRIDKWKAKHEAMLKLAQKTDKKEMTTNKEEEEEEDRKDDLDEKKEELLNLSSSAGICINFNEKDSDSNPHTRHSAALQQALSV